MQPDSTLIRAQFPALDRPEIFFDNPGGTQIARHSLERINQYYLHHNANHGGPFATSRDSDAVLDEGHAAVADLLNAARPEEIVFGNNMTTLTLHVSRSLARSWQPGDEIVVTRLDHDANYSPWVLAAKDRGVTVREVRFHPEDGTLDLDDLRQKLEGRPKLLAVGYASNALGTINPLAEIIPLAHAAGALVYVDAVQYVPHGPVDVQALGCDFLVTSSYKWFGPHAGMLYGRYDLLDGLFAYKVRPASNILPGKFETGTQNHEGIAGVLGAVEYLEWFGQTFGTDLTGGFSGKYSGRKLRLKQGMAALHRSEMEISRTLLDILSETPGLTLYGLNDTARLEQRVPTYSFRLKGLHPHVVAEKLGERGIFVWDGNYYALNVTTDLGLESDGGMVRVGPVHYNTVEEVQRFAAALWKIGKG
ncbi:MAG TPA: cysteine desulfurase-like protein [Bellilinea sp.]|nr:cysteine desulfurase-like protein [Bellilinea sp.]